MKKILSLILALMMLMTVTPAFAEAPAEGNDLLSMFGSLFSDGAEDLEGDGLGGLLNGLMGTFTGGEGGFSLSSLLRPLLVKLRGIKGLNLSVIINTLKQKLGGLLGGFTRSSEGGEGTDLTSLLSGLLGGGNDGSGDGDASELLSLLGGLLGGGDDGSEGGEDAELLALLGSLFGDGEGDGDVDLDKLVEEYLASPEYQEHLARFEALTVHLNEEYAETLDPGDVQIVTDSDILNFDNDDPNIELGYFALTNYTADGTDLKLLNYAGKMELLTYEKQEDGTYKVIDAVIAEEGDNYEPSVEKMCEAYGVPFSDYTELMLWKDFDDLVDLRNFMEEHPEYERIEYMGELKTLAELETLVNTVYDETAALVLGESAEAE